MFQARQGKTQLNLDAASRRARVKRNVAGSLAGAMLFALPAVVPASADPAVPSQEEIDESRRVTAQTAQDIAAMDVQIAELEAQLTLSGDNLSTAAEDYNQAVEQQEEAQKYASEASDKAREAQKRAAQSKKFLVKLARESTRSAQSLDTFAAVINADGIESAVTQSNALALVNDKADKRVQHRKILKISNVGCFCFNSCPLGEKLHRLGFAEPKIGVRVLIMSKRMCCY